MAVTEAAEGRALAVSSDPASPFAGGAVGEVLAVELKDLVFSFRGSPRVLDSFSMTVPAGRLVMVLGASGSGKTTLLKLIKGLLLPRSGEVRLFGSPVRRRGTRGRLSPDIAYIPQQLGLVRSRTTLENALMGALGRVPSWRGLLGLFPAATVRDARQALDTLGIGHKSAERVRSLSGGERQRVAIARALVQRPRILLADEFISQLDPATTMEIMQLVRGVANSGVTVVMTTHELDVVERFAEWVVVLRDGTKLLDCPASEVRTSELAAMMKP
ncbi:MAG: phosphate/phosphonate ABC transporter ATP-binding protein [Anaerolinea sp.]|nr:phosphate/phosphonate ABC transporter ATP-binding protein [Anaerolinea sp.]